MDRAFGSVISIQAPKDCYSKSCFQQQKTIVPGCNTNKAGDRGGHTDNIGDTASVNLEEGRNSYNGNNLGDEIGARDVDVGFSSLCRLIGTICYKC